MNNKDKFDKIDFQLDLIKPGLNALKLLIDTPAQTYAINTILDIFDELNSTVKDLRGGSNERKGE